MQGIAVEEATLRPMVTYFPFGKPYLVFARPVEEFFDGRFQPIPEKNPKEDTAGEAGDSDKKSHGWQGQLIPKIAMDCNKRSLVVGDYVHLYISTAENRRVWGPKDRRKIVDITDGYVQLAPIEGSGPSANMWEPDGLMYAGGTEDGD